MFGWVRTRELERRLDRLEGNDLGVRGSAKTAGEPASPARVGRIWSDNFGVVASRSLQIIIVLGLSVLVIIGMRQLTTVIIPILLALIFASTFAPVMEWLDRRGVPRVLSTVLVLFGIGLILASVSWLITWAVRDQYDELSAQVRDGFEQVMAWVDDLGFAPSEGQLQEWGDMVAGFLTSAQFGSGALTGVGVVANFITGLVLMVVVLFFFLKDGPKIWRFMQRPFEGEGLRRVRRVGAKTVSTLGAYVRGTAAVAAVDAIGISIGLAFLGVPLWIPLGVLVFILAFIPIVGATLAGTLAALVALVANGPLTAVLVIGVVVLVNQLEGNFLQPVLMGRALKLHSLVILLALTVGTVLSGILGAVLAVPIAAVAWGIIKVWDGDDLPAKAFRPQPDELA